MSKSKAQEQIERDNLIAQNRAKFKKNRIVYITPSGNHIAHDLEKDELKNLITMLKESGFECRATNSTSDENFKYFSNDWFKHGEKDWWESYVITTKSGDD